MRERDHDRLRTWYPFEPGMLSAIPQGSLTLGARFDLVAGLAIGCHCNCT